MTPGAGAPAQQREQRKQNLLLASRLARGQAVVAIDELALRADAVAFRVVRAQAWLSSPLFWTAGSALGAFVLARTLRRVRIVRLLRWGWLGWRFWRSAAPVLARYRALGQEPQRMSMPLPLAGTGVLDDAAPSRLNRRLAQVSYEGFLPGLCEHRNALDEAAHSGALIAALHAAGVMGAPAETPATGLRWNPHE